MSKRALLFDLIGLLALLGFFVYPTMIHDPQSFLSGWDNRMAIAWHQYAMSLFSKGEFPYWDPYNYFNFFQTATWIFYPIHFVLYKFISLLSLDLTIKQVYWIYVVLLLFHLYMTSLTMYIFLRHLEIDRVCSITGSIIYTYNLYTLFTGGLMYPYMKMANFACTPLLFLILIKLLESSHKKIEWMILAGILLGGTILIGHPQPLAYYLPLILLFVPWYIFYVQKKGCWTEVRKGLLFAFGIFIISAGISAIQVLPTLFYAADTVRSIKSFDNVMVISTHPIHIMMGSIIPDFGQKGALGNIVGGGFLETLTYMGTPTIILSFLGIFSKHRYLPFFILVLLYGIILMMGRFSFFGYLHYDLIKGIMRFPSRGNHIYIFSMSFLAAVGLKYMSDLFGPSHGKS